MKSEPGTESGLRNLDYTDWCDEILADLAIFLEEQPYGLYGHLDNFAHQYLERRNLDTNQNAYNLIAQVVLDVFGTFGLPDDDKNIHLKHADLPKLKMSYERWKAIFAILISIEERAIVNSVNTLSIRLSENFFLTEEVNDVTLQESIRQSLALTAMSDDELEETLDALHDRKLLHQNRWIGNSVYRATYAGHVRLNRTQILNDEEIDDLRFQGESDSLDYKRVLNITTRKDKTDFAKDVLAFANTGGENVKRILVGVEDNGSFHAPENPELHRQAVMSLVESNLQQIVNERTIQAPSVLIKASGDHRDGPYALIKITSRTSHVPYRFFGIPEDSKVEGATQKGEVWVRKGSTKHPATVDEIAALERRAELFRSTFPGRD